MWQDGEVCSVYSYSGEQHRDEVWPKVVGGYVVGVLLNRFHPLPLVLFHFSLVCHVYMNAFKVISEKLVQNTVIY